MSWATKVGLKFDSFRRPELVGSENSEMPPAAAVRVMRAIEISTAS